MDLAGRGIRYQAEKMKTDPVTLHIISNSLLYASEEMGLALRNAAYSPNIKERMDHSAAIFDRGAGFSPRRSTSQSTSDRFLGG